MHALKYWLPTLIVTLPLTLPLTLPQAGASRSRTPRQIPRLLDPFGLLGKAGVAVQDTMDHVGKTLEAGAKHVGKIVEDGAQQIDAALKKQITQVQSGVEEAGKVAQIVGEDLVDSVSAIVNKHMANQKQWQEVDFQPEAQAATLLQEQSFGENDDPEVEVAMEDEEDPNELLKREGVFDGVLRMFGVDPNQIGLMALNVLIFLAELITSTLISDEVNDIPETRSGEGNGASLADWIFNGNNPKQLDNFLREAQDPALPRKVIERLVSSTGNGTACVQLLVCKLSPVVWGVQRSVKDAQQQQEEGRGIQDHGGVLQMMYDSLPHLGDFVRFSESCEKQFPACPLLDLAGLGL